MVLRKGRIYRTRDNAIIKPLHMIKDKESEYRWKVKVIAMGRKYTSWYRLYTYDGRWIPSTRTVHDVFEEITDFYNPK